MADMPAFGWVYRARPVRVIDGDSIICVVDAGFGLWIHPGNEGARLRLLGVDTPERNEPGWSDARYYTLAWLTDANVSDWPLRIQTQRADNFGRYLADVWAINTSAHLNDDLIASGHAVPYGGAP